MKEKVYAKIRMGNFAAALLTGVTMTGCGVVGDKEDDVSGYRFKITQYFPQHHVVVRQYTNDEPEIERDGNKTMLKATNVYCPQSQFDRGQIFKSAEVPKIGTGAWTRIAGCANKFTEKLEVVGDRDIVIFSNAQNPPR